MAVRVYSNSLPGAPAHPSATRGSMALLLRKCLVEGWTSGETVVEPAGWEESHEELNYYSCFRSLVGAKQFFRINDATTDTDVTIMQAGESLADVDGDLIGQWGSHYFGKRYDANSQQWVLIADEKTCYVVLQSYYGNVIHGFGEFNSLIPDDPYNSFLSGHSDSGGLEDNNENGLHAANAPGTDDYIDFHRGAGGGWAPGGSLVGINGVTIPGGQRYQVDPASLNTGLNWIYLPAMVSCSDSYAIRGTLRGCFMPLAYKPLGHKETITDPDTGHELMCIHFDTDNESDDDGCLLFDITGPW